MKIDIQTFIDSTLIGYIMAAWIGILTYGTVNGLQFFLLAILVISAYGFGKSVSYQHAVDEA